MTIRIDPNKLITTPLYVSLPPEHQYHYQLIWLYKDIGRYRWITNREDIIARFDAIQTFKDKL